MAIQSPIVLASGFFSQLFPGDTVPGTDTTAQASGNAALVLANTALASGNAGISTGLTALASGNAGLVSASNKVPISGGYMTGQLFAASGVVVSGTLSRNGFNVVTVGDVETVTSTMIASGTIIDADVNISGAINATKLNFLQAGASGVARTVDSKLKDTVSVKDFGAVGDGVTDDVTAFTNALATGKNVYVPQGSYLVSATVSISQGQILQGAGQHKTTIIYTGAATGVYLGAPGNVQLIYNCELRDLTVSCTNRGVNVIGVHLENCVYFNVVNLSIFGSGSPNDPTPANQILYGYGLYLSNNTIIGNVHHVSCRLWDIGYYLKTLPASQSYWTAAIVFGGQGELANVMRGIVVGDPTVNLYSGVGVTFRDLSLQGCYTVGIDINSGDNTVIQNCYFEGNANYDIRVGTASGAPTPLNTRIINNTMNAEDIGVTPYGNFPYIAKIYVNRGTFTTIRDNAISISTAIPLISLDALSDTSNISGNRLNSTIASTGRILDNSTSTITADNYPEKARVFVGTLTRNLSGATGNVSYTGVGFKPTSIEFTAAVDTVAEFCVGYTGGSAQNRCLTSDASGNKSSSSDCIKIVRSTSSDIQRATLASFDADGFTLSWVLQGSPPGNNLVVNYIARR